MAKQEKRPMKKKQPVGQPSIYSEELCDQVMDFMELWVFGSTQVLTEEGFKTIPNVHYFQFKKQVYETFNIIIPKLLNSIRNNKPEQYERFQELKEIMAERLAEEALKENVSVNFAKYYLSAKYKGWSEKSETKNENHNFNQEIVWEEIKQYDKPDNQVVEDDNDEK